jgi:hypothetical protein
MVCELRRLGEPGVLVIHAQAEPLPGVLAVAQAISDE